jgi:hypothetical protein
MISLHHEDRAVAYVTTFRRAALALLVGAAAPAVSSALVEAIAGLCGAYGTNFSFHEPAQVLSFFGTRRSVWILLWIAGLSIFGVPAWLLLHWMNLRSWPNAVALGFGTCFLLVFGLSTGFGLLPYDPPGSASMASDSGGVTMVNGVLTQHGWFGASISSLGWGIVGAVVGLVIWRAAYRKRAA